MGGKVPAKAGAPLTDSSGMPFATSNDAEQLRRIGHELAEALTATSSYLRAGQSVANQGSCAR